MTLVYSTQKAYFLFVRNVLQKYIPEGEEFGEVAE